MFPSFPFCRIAIAWACALGAAHAALDFDTYRIVKTKTEVTHDGVTMDSTSTTYDLTRLGSTSLEASSITLTSHGDYLTVLEEATLTGNVQYRPQEITYDFLLQGSLPIPPLAAVHSLTALHGDTLYPTKLIKMAYTLDNTFLDTNLLRATLDGRVAFLQQLSDAGFEATFSHLSLGEPVRVRIQYDLPFPGAPGSSIRIPVLFHPSGQAPQTAHITFLEQADGQAPLLWQGDTGPVTLKDSETLTVPYRGEFLFRRDQSPGPVASMQSTVFESGSFKGNYLLLKAGLNDSLMNILSRKLEVTFLWRWNPPYDFVTTDGGLKTLSANGQLAAQEAKTLKRIITEMAPRGHRFGLMRSAPGFEDDFFPPSDTGTEAYGKLLAYLDGFDEQRLYADFKDYAPEKPIWAPTQWKDSGEVARSQKEFLEALKRIHNASGDDPETLRHIEMIGLGYVPPTGIDLDDPEKIETVIDSMTISNVLASWPGVDLESALNVKADASLRILNLDTPLPAGLPPLLFPVFQPSSVEYRAFTAGRSHSVVLGFSRDSQREAVIKAAAPFADTLEIQGIDALGRKTRIFTLRPNVLTAESDSGLPRLWAADPDRIFENSEVDLGMRYGILTKGSYWGAGIDAAIEVQTDGPPATALILPGRVTANGGRTFRVEHGFLRIEAGVKGMKGAKGADPWGPSPRLEIYDLRGRLVLALSLSEFRRDGGFSVPVELFRKLDRSRLVIALRGAGRFQPIALSFGGLK